MPYCQVTPCLERGIILLHSRLCVPHSCTKVVYDPSKGTLELHSVGGSVLRSLNPTVCLRPRRTKIPRESGIYTVYVNFKEVECGTSCSKYTSISAEAACKGVFSTGSQVLLGSEGTGSIESTLNVTNSCSSNLVSSKGVSHTGSGSGFTVSSCANLGVVDTKARLAKLFGGDSDAATCPTRSTVECCGTTAQANFYTGFHGLEIVRYCIESIFGRRLDEASFSLTWRIRIHTSSLKHLQLKLAAVQGTALGSSVRQYAFFALRCKCCCNVLKCVDSATLIPLPSEFYTTTSGSTFCEECEPHLVSNAPSLARSRCIIYEGEDCVTLYSPGITTKVDGSILCGECGCFVGRYSDNTKEFICYRKSCVGGFSGDFGGDIFWRHSPEVECIESLLYDKRMRLVVGVDNELPERHCVFQVSVLVGSGLQKCRSCVELIKVSLQPDTFVICNNNVFEASRILWRPFMPVDDKLDVVLSVFNFEHFLGVLEYFSQESDPFTGYTPSILLAV